MAYLALRRSLQCYICLLLLLVARTFLSVRWITTKGMKVSLFQSTRSVSSGVYNRLDVWRIDVQLCEPTRHHLPNLQNLVHHTSHLYFGIFSKAGQKWCLLVGQTALLLYPRAESARTTWLDAACTFVPRQRRECLGATFCV